MGWQYWYWIGAACGFFPTFCAFIVVKRSKRALQTQLRALEMGARTASGNNPKIPS